jgi:hypothetical protein
MTDEVKTDKPGLVATWPRWLVRGIGFLVLFNLAVLAGQLVLRCAFPWDLFMWAESPFMTGLLKLDSGQPVFGPPADGNSFIYSPGLLYLTYALLKPLGLHLDIRYCRIVIVLIGVMAGGWAGWAARRALQMVAPEKRIRGFAWLGAGIAVLVIFKNFTADATHPDNLVMLHTAGLLWLTLKAVQCRSFSWALTTMAFAGLGVFAKQTLCVAFVGPALVFLRFKPWGTRKGLMLAVAGALASGLALAVLWHPEFSRFYTWEVLARQKIHATRLYWMLVDLVHADRALLAVLALAALATLWRAGATSRQYLQIWIALGLCSVAPGALAYAKHFGTWNNLIIHQLWLLLLVLPALGVWLGRASLPSSSDQAPFNFLVGAVLTLFVLALLPTRFPADRAMQDCCAAVQERVTADIKAGRRVMVAHGTMYRLRAGSREIPLDQATSVVELGAAGFGGQINTAARIRSHYYDRLYLPMEEWYDEATRAAIHQHYAVDEVIPQPKSPDRVELGRWLVLMGECKILSPRMEVPAETSIVPAGKH